MVASNFSIFALFTAGLAALVSADAGPTANAVRLPGLGSIVPANKPYEIKWDADAPYAGGTVTLVLLKGPSNNAVPIATIAAGTPNDGSFEWTPSADLEDSKGPTGYGIKMIIDANGAYQYTTQFGISNDKAAVVSSSAAASSVAASSAAVSSPAVSSAPAVSTLVSMVATPVVTPAADGAVVTEIVTAFTTFCPVATELTHNGKTYTMTTPGALTITDCPNGCTITKPVTVSTMTACSTCSASSPVVPVPVPQPTTGSVHESSVGGSSPNPPYAPISNGTASYSKPALASSTKGASGTPAATTPGSPLFTGAASAMKASGVVGAAAVMGAAFFAL